MKNQGLRRLGRLILWGGILLLWCQVTGCAGRVSGRVFLDTNNNGVMDTNETGVPQVKMSILVDGKTERTGYTSPAGSFSVKSKWQKGSVCVKIEEKIEASVTTSGGKALSLPTFLAQCTDSNGNGLCDNQESTSSEDNQNDGEREVEDDVEQPITGWSENGFCAQLKYGYADINIPIQIDHETTIAEIPEYESKERFAGEEFEQRILKPADCELKPFQLPSEIELAEGSSPAVSIDIDTNVVTFLENSGDKIIRPRIRATVTETATNASAQLDRVTLKLKVREDISTTAKEITLKPVAICGSEAFDLPEIPMTVKRDVNFIVYNDRQVRNPDTDEEFQISVKIRNRGKSPIPRGELEVILAEGISISPTATNPMPSNCRTSGLRITCYVDRIAAGTQTTLFLFKLRTPFSISAPTTYRIKSSFTPEGLDKKDADDDIVFSLDLS